MIKDVDAPTGGDSGDADGADMKSMNTLPKTLNHYVMPRDGSTSGGLLTVASFLVKGMQEIADQGKAGKRKVLFVITKKCGITIHHTIGAMSHFNVHPKPQSLIDLLDAGEGTEKIMGLQRSVTGVTGLGQSNLSSTLLSTSGSNSNDEQECYVLVTGEDNVRGLHLDRLDSVIIVGRPTTPDSYIHIAGRAGRAGRRGTVVNIVDYDQGSAVTSWENMLGVDFIPLEEGDAAGVL